MPQELFNQTLKTSLGDDDRIAASVPGAVGADNIKYSVLLAQIAGDIVRSGSDEVVTSGSQDITFSSDFGTTDYGLFIVEQNGNAYNVTAKATDKFTIDMIAAGTINYIAIKNI